MNSPSDQLWEIKEEDTGTRLDKWLAAAARLGSRSHALAAIERGKVFVNDIEQTSSDAAHALKTGEIVRLWLDRPGSSQKRYSERHASGLHLLYEDQSLIVVDKPPGVLSVPLPSQHNGLSIFDLIKIHLRSKGKRQPLIVHRIDRDTSGLVVFAKTVDAQKKLKDQFEHREAERIYQAVVYGHPQPDSGTWRNLLVWDQEKLIQRHATRGNERAKEAVSHYRILEKFKDASLIEVRLVTGKRNQIRIQAGLRGHTLVGEKKYVYQPPRQKPIEFNRQALHAFRLSFLHPVDERRLSFEAEIPKDIEDLVRKMRG